MRRPRCASPGCKAVGIHAHHVALQQHLTAAQKRDPRATIPVCLFHHFSHHGRSITLPASVLTEANWEFLHEVFPTWADDYVRRYYSAEG